MAGTIRPKGDSAIDTFAPPTTAPAREFVRALQVENDQLRTALRTRIAIEQAKGILAERYELTLDEAFALLRSAARAHRKKIHLLASEVIPARTTPVDIARTIATEARR